VSLLEQPVQENSKFPNWKDIFEKYTSSPEKKVVTRMIQLLKKNDIFTYADWVKLTKETKDDLCMRNATKFPIPPVIRQILDEASQGKQREKNIARFDSVDDFYKEIVYETNEPLDSIFENFSEIFYSFKDINVTIPTLGWFSPQNNWIREKSFPAFQGNIDWRYLDGDGGDPSQKTKTTLQLLKYLENDQVKMVKNAYFLLGVAGCGKTKAIYDVAKEKYVVLLDFIKNGRARDISYLMEYIDKLAQSNDVLIDRKTRTLVFRTFLARLHLLTLLFGTKQVTSPKDWLLLQLDPSIQDTLEKINVHLQQFSWKGMLSIFSFIVSWFSRQNHSIIAAIDEANVLLGTLPDTFMDSNSRAKSRPLSSCVLSCLSENIQNTVTLIVSGTHLELI
jgi:hypothetical protein